MEENNQINKVKNDDFTISKKIELVNEIAKKNIEYRKGAPTIEVKNLVVDFGESQALKGSSFDILKGELVCLLGPSGCGKTTTLNAIAGLLTPTFGKITFSGKNITKYSPQKRKLGLVFQNYALYPHLSTYNNIAFPLKNDDNWKKSVAHKNILSKLRIDEIILLSNGATQDEVATLKYKNKTYININKETKEYLDRLTNDVGHKLDDAKTAIKLCSIQKQGSISRGSKETLKKLDELKSSLKDKMISESEYGVQTGQVKKAYKNDLRMIKNKYKFDLEYAKEQLIIEKENYNNSPKHELIKEAKSNRKHFPAWVKEDYQTYKNQLIEKYSLDRGRLSAEQVAECERLRKKIVSIRKAVHNAIMEVAIKVDIVPNLHKNPTKLSGGQQQRVAIARAIVKKPNVLLLDEPLSNLDAKLRISTRDWIKSMQQELGITTVFVTHDQDEAMAISDKIILMSDGEIQQIGKPIDLYRKPQNEFVAQFLGVPEMKIFKLAIVNQKAILNSIPVLGVPNANVEEIKIGIRPEHFKEVKKGIESEIISIEHLGKDLIAKVSIENHGVTKVFLRNKDSYEIGEKVFLEIPTKKMHIFSADGKRLENV